MPERTYTDAQVREILRRAVEQGAAWIDIGARGNRVSKTPRFPKALR